MYSADEIRKSMRLYAVTDRVCLKNYSLQSAVEEALLGGVSCIQLREKKASNDDIELLARSIKPLCVQAHVPLIINDAVEVAVKIEADGVHIGQHDMSCSYARSKMGPHAIIGVSVQTLDQAMCAQTEGADYLGVGAMFPTPTKPDAAEVSFEELRRICASVSIPVVVIGGISAQTIPLLADTGIDGIAVVSAIFGADNIKEASESLLRNVNEIL